ncbi:hypothetical protein CVT26_007908 [Gymnopilus dilepis]|uniref:Uncharacterized protein n=1 Tax=Gymnopilus dilepis TaxID=231916 RepID=A0A409X837_9AGAR|nr:hypothetical protein CVT26_007908 [Gymnopilus dilepis]
MARSSGPPKDPPPSSQGAQNHKLCGVVQEAAARANERHRKRTKPQPWIVRKLMIGVTLGIMGYAAYVYIRQVCLPMVWRREGAGAGRGTGVALLVVFCVLYLWMIWAYAMVHPLVFLSPSPFIILINYPYTRSA